MLNYRRNLIRRFGYDIHRIVLYGGIVVEIERIMDEYGFGISSSGGGCDWYTKEIDYNGKAAFIAVTVEDG